MLRYLIVLSLFVTGFTTGCAALKERKRVESFTIRDLESSVADIRAAISASIPVGVRNVSPNGREIYSKHFLAGDGNRFRPANDAIERYYVQYAILGDRRPYDVTIIVAHEKRVLRGETFVYVVDYYDNVLARDLANKIQDDLAKRREDRNIIDDFRVF